MVKGNDRHEVTAGIALELAAVQAGRRGPLGRVTVVREMDGELGLPLRACDACDTATAGL